jgi:hypothetical protein
VLTRPLGASIGDYLSQSPTDGGLGLGATLTSLIFFAGIIAIVVYLSVTKADVIRGASDDAATVPTAAPSRTGLLQTVVVLGILLSAAFAGYVYQARALARAAAAEQVTAAPSDPTPGSAPDGAPGNPATPAPAAPPATKVGDLSQFRTITQDTRDLLDRGDQSGATTRVTDLETAWDDAQARLKPRDPAAWTTIDGKIDTVLRELRSTSPDPASEKTALDDLLAALH